METTDPSAPTTTLRQDAGVIGFVSLAHSISHFSQLLLPPLFPWLKDAFSVSYAELGFLLTVFFVVSCIVQALSGFVVDRFGPRPVLFGGLALLGLAAFGYAISTSYWMLAFFVAIAGLGNGVFHPVDFTLINLKVAKHRLGHAYSVHGITGSLGWAVAPVLLVPIAMASSWRVALAVAGGIALLVLAIVWLNRGVLALDRSRVVTAHAQDVAEGTFDFLRIPAVWMCFWFFTLFAIALSAVQSFAPEAARQLHAVPMHLVAICLTTYMVCSAGGMVFGGFLATDPTRCERIVAFGLGVGAVIALTLAYAHVAPMAVPVLFGALGFASGLAGPSRDLLVKRSSPANATGRVYGVVYSGLDIGQALAPLAFGMLMDLHRYSAVFAGLALVQALLIISAFNVGRARTTVSGAVAA